MSATPPPVPIVATVDVSYSVKELFEKVDGKLDRISEQLDRSSRPRPKLRLQKRHAS